MLPPVMEYTRKHQRDGQRMDTHIYLRPTMYPHHTSLNMMFVSIIWVAVCVYGNGCLISPSPQELVQCPCYIGLTDKIQLGLLFGVSKVGHGPCSILQGHHTERSE